MIPDGYVLLNGEGQEMPANLRAEQVVMASLEFAKVEEIACPEYPDGGDPLGMCPSCASMKHRAKLHDGELATAILEFLVNFWLVNVV